MLVNFSFCLVSLDDSEEFCGIEQTWNKRKVESVTTIQGSLHFLKKHPLCRAL